MKGEKISASRGGGQAEDKLVRRCRMGIADRHFERGGKKQQCCKQGEVVEIQGVTKNENFSSRVAGRGVPGDPRQKSAEI